MRNLSVRQRARLVLMVGSMLFPVGMASPAQTPAQSGSDRVYSTERTAPASPAPADQRSYDLLPSLRVDRHERPDNEYRSPVGGYIRFWIERDQETGNVGEAYSPTRRYSDEHRDWISRFFLGRNYARILEARLIVRRSTLVTQNITLASAAHNSNNHDGENWSTSLGDRRYLTPFFRVDQGSTAEITVTMSATADVDASVTRNLLAVIQAGVRLAAPTGPLVTALNGDRLNQASTFADTAISQLFHEKIVETSASDFPADHWGLGSDFLSRRRLADGRPDPISYYDRTPVATITAWFPMGRHLWSGADTQDIGVWHVYATAPIVSMFSTVPFNPVTNDPGNPTYIRCRAVSQDDHDDNATSSGQDAGRSSRPRTKAIQDAPPPTPHNIASELAGPELQACMAFAGLAPARVLGLQIDDNVTLGQALRGDESISGAIQRFQSTVTASRQPPSNPPQGNNNSKANSAPTAQENAAWEICNLVAARTEALGLNAFDAAAAVWAYAYSGGITSDLASRIWDSGCATASLARRLGLSKPSQAASSAPSAVQPEPGPGAQEPAPAQPPTP